MNLLLSIAAMMPDSRTLLACFSEGRLKRPTRRNREAPSDFKCQRPQAIGQPHGTSRDVVPMRV
jgi:hypothetical protein